jgi:predicted secreted Zn-dependent protease
MTFILRLRFGDYDGGPLKKEFKYFSINAKEASKSGLLNSYGTHHPSGPNLRLSMTIEWRKQIV